MKRRRMIIMMSYCDFYFYTSTLIYCNFSQHISFIRSANINIIHPFFFLCFVRTSSHLDPKYQNPLWCEDKDVFLLFDLKSEVMSSLKYSNKSSFLPCVCLLKNNTRSYDDHIMSDTTQPPPHDVPFSLCMNVHNRFWHETILFASLLLLTLFFFYSSFHKSKTRLALVTPSVPLRDISFAQNKPQISEMDGNDTDITCRNLQEYTDLRLRVW